MFSLFGIAFGLFLMLLPVMIFITSLVLVFKYERGLSVLIWLGVIFFLPVFGSVFYLIKHILTGKQSKLQSEVAV